MKHNSIYKTIALAAACALLLGACAQGRFSKPDEESNELRIQRVIASAGENAGVLSAFLETYPEGTEQRRAGEYLLASMPLGDAAGISSAELRETVEYAFQAKETFPWAEDLDFDVFLQYVLPHRVAQEPFTPHRKMLFHELRPRVEFLKDPLKAAMELVMWCREKMEYVTTSRRDQSVVATLTRGKGRCEEAVILYVAAARSIGIPARLAITPSWIFSNDNHAWVEVWADGEWHYLDPANPSPIPGWAWFSEKARNTALIQATAYGRMNALQEPELRSGNGYTLINRTEAYAPANTLNVEVLGPDGKEASKPRVYASVFNYGTLMPFARIQCDEDGEGRLVTGKCSFFLTTCIQGICDYEVVELGRSNPESGGEEKTVVLDVRRNRLPKGGYTLKFAPWLPLEQEPLPDDMVKAFIVEKERRTEIRKKAEQKREQDLKAATATLEQDPEISETLQKMVLEAGSNGYEVLKAYEQAGELKTVLLIYLQQLTAKDLSEISAGELLEEIEAAGSAVQEVHQALNTSYEDDILSMFVLDNRISLYEPYSAWRRPLRARFSHFVVPGATVRDVAAKVNEYTRDLELIKPFYFGSTPTPMEIVTSGSVPTEMERGIVATAVLRSLGIPARFLYRWVHGNWVEYYDGERWNPLYPEAPDFLDDEHKNAETTAYYSQRAELEVSFVSGEKPLADTNMQYYRDFALTGLIRSFQRGEKSIDAGVFALQELGEGVFGGYDADNQVYRFAVPAGEYFLMAAKRNGIGEPYLYIEPVTVRSGEKRRIRVDMKPK